MLFHCSLVYSIHKIMPSENNKILTSYFLAWMPVISFSCLIVLTRSSRIILNESSESEYPCLVPEIKKKAFSISPFSLMLTVTLLYDLCYVEILLLLNLIYSKFFLWKDVEFYQMFYLHLFRWPYGFCFSFNWYEVLCLLICICRTILSNLI
jgi:hypothetical protein